MRSLERAVALPYVCGGINPTSRSVRPGETSNFGLNVGTQLMPPYGPQSPDDPDLRSLARDKIASKALPCVADERLWAGHGKGETCAVCDKEIEPRHVLYEIEAGKSGTIQFHLACHAAWRLECSARGTQATVV